MNLSREAKIVSGITLLAVPTIMYGGVTLLAYSRRVRLEFPPGTWVDETQWALFRAGIAHAECGCPVSCDPSSARLATLSPKLKWLVRIAAPLAAWRHRRILWSCFTIPASSGYSTSGGVSCTCCFLTELGCCAEQTFADNAASKSTVAELLDLYYPTSPRNLCFATSRPPTVQPERPRELSWVPVALLRAAPG